MIVPQPDIHPHPASFRDPAGFVFRQGDTWYRQVNTSYRQQYGQLMGSGLYAKLTGEGLLLPHQEIAENLTGRPDWFTTLRPEQLSFISYPEEWSPAQLKDAALCTLTILRTAIDYGMILKDATPRNIQFPAGRPMLIDSLSFESYDPSRPWIAYRQFCECFLYPLYLHHYYGEGTHRTLLAWPDGIPAGAVARLLPPRSRWSLGAWLHIRLAARIEKDGKPAAPAPAFSRKKLLHLLSNLESTVRGLDTNAGIPSAWSEYYEKTILSQAYLREKEKLFRQYLETLTFMSALDLGANEGHFSRILAEKNATVIAVDSAWQCVDHLYRQLPGLNGAQILPLCVDIANPTPATGFMNAEKPSFTSRSQCSLVTALALVHHLSLGRNIPLSHIADYFCSLAEDHLIIEFVPLSDPKAVELLAGRTIPGYDRETFESCFGIHFIVGTKTPIPGTDRILYLMKKRRR
jgi:hypothetical protein